MRLWHQTSLLLHMNQPLLQGKPHLFSDTYCSSYLQAMQINYYKLITENGHNFLFFLPRQRVKFCCDRSIAAWVIIFFIHLNFLFSDIIERTLEFRNEHAKVSKMAAIINWEGKCLFCCRGFVCLFFFFREDRQQSHLY